MALARMSQEGGKWTVPKGSAERADLGRKTHALRWCPAGEDEAIAADLLSSFSPTNVLVFVPLVCGEHGGWPGMRILILAGTSEAGALAAACAARRDWWVISSLAGRTRAPRAPLGAVRVGGFGGAAGLERFLCAERIDRVVDASHPFAVRIERHAVAAAAAAGVPRLRLLRPPWRRVEGDRWLEVGSPAEAARLLPDVGRRAFLTVGQQELAAFGGVEGVWCLVRTIEPPARLPPGQMLGLQARGPFALADELELLRAHRIDVLVTKASGGEATYPKLAAARQLGLPVIMVRRPPAPPGPLVDSIEAALAWLQRP